MDALVPSPVFLNAPQSAMAATGAVAFYPPPFPFALFFTFFVTITLAVGSVIYIAIQEKKEEDGQAALRRRVADLEDSLAETTDAFQAAARVQKEEAVAFRSDLARMREILVELEEALSMVEDRIPRGARVLRFSQDDYAVYDGQKLVNPRLLVKWLQFPEGTPSDSVPLKEYHQWQGDATASTQCFRVIPSGQKTKLLNATLWHSTPGIRGDLDFTDMLRPLFDE